MDSSRTRTCTYKSIEHLVFDRDSANPAPPHALVNARRSSEAATWAHEVGIRASCRAQRLLRGSLRKANFPVNYLDGDAAQPHSTARTAGTLAGFDPEVGAVRGANQQSVFDQELAGRPVEAPPGMRTFVVKRRDLTALARDNQIEPTGAGFNVRADRSPVGDGIQLA